MYWQCRDRRLDLTRPVVMGVLNVTPDSFSDGGRYASIDQALARAAAMLQEGAAIIDVGGESTRPGAVPVEAEVELDRVLPTIAAIARELDVAISVDTSKPQVMRAAFAAGAHIANDVLALRAAGARECVAENGAGACLMHMQGTPSSMHQNPAYTDVVATVAAFLSTERQHCLAAGISADRLVLDPGFGFGKNNRHNLALLKDLPVLAALGSPLLVGLSRKSLIGHILNRPVADRVYGGLGLAAYAVMCGARIIRTHDVGPTVEALLCLGAAARGSDSDT
jgi:dihydropteroate synthase